MPAIITTKFRLYTSQQFKESFEEAENDNIYLFIGKTTAWEDDQKPLIPLDNISTTDYNIYNSMIAMKKINTGFISNVVKRIDWQENQFYDMYDDKEEDLFNKRFYVLTDDYNVYKILDNNNTSSKIKPSGTDYTPFITSDGYKWQYMFTVSSSESVKFLTPEWLPLKTINKDDGSTQWQVQTNTVTGSIEHITIENGGKGFTTSPKITITGDGQGAKAKAILKDGVITKIDITARGSNYSYAFINIANNKGAVVRAIISPKNGHGSDCVEELGGYYTMLNVRLEYGEGGVFPVQNDFRNIGLIINPLEEKTKEKANKLVYPLYSNFTLSEKDRIPFGIDEKITGQNSKATGNVIYINSDTIQVNEIVGKFEIGEVIRGNNSGVTGRLAEVKESEIKKYSGVVIYNENRSPIVRSQDQIEDIKLIIEF